MRWRWHSGSRTTEAIAMAAYCLHNYGWGPDNDRERLDLAELGLAAAERAFERYLEVDLRGSRGHDLLALGEVDAFRANIGKLHETLERTRYRSERYFVPASLAALALADGRLVAAEDHWRSTREIRRPTLRRRSRRRLNSSDTDDARAPA